MSFIWIILNFILKLIAFELHSVTKTFLLRNSKKINDKPTIYYKLRDFNKISNLKHIIKKQKNHLSVNLLAI